MKQVLSTKEELQKQLDAISEKELKEVKEKYYPEFKKYEGRFFKYRNSYGGASKPSDNWWMYTKVTGIKPNDIYDTGGDGGITSHFTGWSFQTCKYGTFSVEQQKHGYIHNIGKEITEEEFNTAWNNAMAVLNKLK